MPNWCQIKMNIIAATPHEAKKITAVLEQGMTEAQRKNIGLFMGSELKYLFHCDCNLVDNTIFLNGNVKWSLNGPEASEWIQWLKGHGEIAEVKLGYKELSALIYGRYYFDGKFLFDIFLPSEFFPEYDEYDFDSREHQLEKNLDTYGISILISNIN